MKSVPHICTIKRYEDIFFSSPMSKNASFSSKIARDIRTCISVSEEHPRILEFYRTKSALIREQREHFTSKNWYIIHPLSKFNNVFLSIMDFVYLLQFLIFPYIAVFEEKNLMRVNFPNILLTFANLFCITNIILGFFTGYVEPKMKTAVMNQKHIIRHHISRIYFIFDVISSLPTDIIGYFCPDNRQIIILHILRLVKFTRFFKLQEDFGRGILFKNWNKTVIDSVRYFLVAILILNWSTCLYWFIRNNVLKLHISFEPAINGFSIASYASTSLFFCIYTHDDDNFLALVKNTKEIEKTGESYIFFNIPNYIYFDFLLLCFGKYCIAVFTVLIITHLLEHNILEIKYQATINQISEYLKIHRAPLELRKKMFHYYDHRYQKKYFREKVIYAILSMKLRQEMTTFLRNRLVDIVQIFSELPPNVLEELLKKLKHAMYLPNDMIIRAGTMGDCLYFLFSGTVAVYTPSGREICHLTDGAYFGEISLILRYTKRTTNIVAIEVCEVYSLAYDDFLTCFDRDDNEVYKKMKLIAEQRLEKTASLDQSHALRLYKGFSDEFEQIYDR